MNSEKTIEPGTLKSKASDEISGRLDAIGWGILFVWIGFALLVNIEFGITILGVGLITLGVQAAHKYNSLKVEGFWVISGALFLFGGIWELAEMDLNLPVVPLLLIAAGVALLVSIFRGKANPDKAHQ